MHAMANLRQKDSILQVRGTAIGDIRLQEVSRDLDNVENGVEVSTEGQVSAPLSVPARL